MTGSHRALTGIAIAAALTLMAQTASGADCGGAVPCACGDRLIADRTLVFGVDPITTTICTGDGLVVARSPSTTLDLGGNTIRGDGRNPDTTGVLMELFASGHTVTGGRITGFGAGIAGEDIEGNRFVDLQLTANTLVGISLGEANQNVIEQIIVSRMSCGTGGIAVSGGSNVVRLNRVEFNRFTGVSPAAVEANGGGPGEPGANIVSRNVVRQNSTCGPTPVAGFRVRDNGATVELNRSEDHDGDGFIVTSFSVDPELPGMTVARNVAIRNGGNGFTVAAADSRFERNSARYNGGFGIQEQPAAGAANTYVSNVCTGNALGDSDPPGLCD
jgi:hypothetical protein